MHFSQNYMASIKYVLLEPNDITSFCSSEGAGKPFLGKDFERLIKVCGHQEVNGSRFLIHIYSQFILDKYS